MSDWAIRDTPRPYAFIQWKGTDVCADYYYVCGKQFHVDADFVYYVQCCHCQRRYEVSSHIELREMSPGEEPDADCKVDTDSDPFVDRVDDEADTAAGLLKK